MNHLWSAWTVAKFPSFLLSQSLYTALACVFHHFRFEKIFDIPLSASYYLTFLSSSLCAGLFCWSFTYNVSLFLPLCASRTISIFYPPIDLPQYRRASVPPHLPKEKHDSIRIINLTALASATVLTCHEVY